MRNTSKSNAEKISSMFPIPTNSRTGIFKGKAINGLSKRPLFGVVVELLGTGRAYVTSPTGYFKLVDVPEGIYVVRFTYPGFMPVEEAISVQDSETLDLTVAFERAE